MYFAPRPLFHGVFTPACVVASTELPLEDATPIASIDPGWASPTVVLRGWLLASGSLHICEEYTFRRTRIALALDRLCDDTYPPPVAVALDPAGWQHEPASGLCVADIVRAFGLDPWKAVMSRRLSLNMLRRRFAGGEGGTEITIDPSCAWTREACEHFAIGPCPAHGPHVLTPNHGHYIDALRYICGLAVRLAVLRSPD